MRKNANIELQGFYTCKVTNKVVTVQILTSSPKGGWQALNTATGKKIYIQSPERLIKKVAAPKNKKVEKAPKVTAAKKSVKKKAAKKVSPKAKTSAASKPGKAAKKDGKLSMLDAAAKVLGKQSPLSCRQIVEKMAEAKLWETDAATPANTLHAAFSKEIRVKGKDSRFEKVERGKFGLKAKK